MYNSFLQGKYYGCYKELAFPTSTTTATTTTTTTTAFGEYHHDTTQYHLPLTSLNVACRDDEDGDECDGGDDNDTTKSHLLLL